MARVYLDSCIVIYILESPEDRGEGILERISPQSGRHEVYVSDLTELECMVRPLREGRIEVIETYQSFFRRATTRFAPLSKKVFLTASQIRADFNIKTPDALHLAFAIEGGCEEFWTNDRHLQKAVGDRLKIVLPVE